MQPVSVSKSAWKRILVAKSGNSRLSCDESLPEEKRAMELYGPLLRSSKEPLIFAQIGQSIDGRVATVTEDSRDISGEDGLVHLHRLRAIADAVVIGVTTAIQDHPRLTVRFAEGDSPARVVIDPTGRLPNEAGLLREDSARRIVIQACDKPRPDGVEVVRLDCDQWISAKGIADALADLGFRRVLIEGGGTTITQFLEAGLLDRLHVTIAPLLIGSGLQGLSTTSPIPSLAQALRPKTHVYNLGSDVLFDCDIASCAEVASLGSPANDTVRALAAR